MYYPGNYLRDWKEPRRSQSVESVFLPNVELGTAIKQVDGAEIMPVTIIMMVVVPYGLREPPELLSADTHNHDEPLGE
jgi:hypothetical protein